MPGPTLTVHPSDNTPQSCTFSPDTPLHAPTKSQNGFVNFNATAACTINFTNAAVFGTDSLPLNQGNNQVPVEADPPQGQQVSTYVTIQGCARSVGARVAAGPAEIIVP